MNPNQPPAGPKDYQARAIALIDNMVADCMEGLANTRLRGNCVRSTAEVLRLRDRVAMAEHFFASPESFSNEEFQAVANVVVGCSHYNGKMPYLDEVVRLRDENQRLMDLIRAVRHPLHSDKLISDAEFAALVADAESGERVARLESYDKMRAENAALSFELETVREAARFLKEDNAALREQVAKVKASARII